MVANYVVSDDDLMPSTQQSTPSVYAVTDDDLTLPSKVEAPPISSSNLSPNSMIFPDVNYKNQLGSLGAYLAAIPKRFGEMGANTNKYLSNALGLKAAADPFNYPQGSFLQQLEQNHPTATGAGNLTSDIGTLGILNPTSIAGLAATSGAQGALTNPQSPIKSGLEQGAMGGTLGTVGKGLQWGINAAGNALSNPVSEAANRLGINLPLGEATQNPYLSKFSQNALTRIPFSGATSGYAQTGKQLDDAVSGALDSIKPTTPLSQIPQNIQDALQSSYDDAQKMKRSLYKNVDTQAKESGITVDNDNYLNGYTDPNSGAHISGVNEILSRSEGTTPELQLSSSTRNFLQQISDANKPKNYLGTSATMESMPFSQPFSDASLVRGKLNDLAYGMSQSTDPFQRGEGNLLQGLRQLKLMDMQSAVDKSGNPDLMNAYNDAQNNYANNIAPYDEPTIKKYLSSGSKADNPDLIIQSFLKTGQNNQPTLLNNLLNKLPESQKQDAGYYFLTRSLPRDETGNPIINTNTITKFNNNLQKYDPQIRNQLIPPKVQQTLSDVDTVRETVPKLLLNPPTGAQGADLAALGLLGSLFGSAAATGHPLAGLGYVGGVLAGGRAANSALRSPTLKNYLMRNPNTMRLAQVLSGIGNSQQ